jgi:hypothetical protein
MEVSGQLHAPATLPPGKSPWYPLDRRLGGPQSRSGFGGEEKNSQPLPGLEPPIIQRVAQRYTTELSRLPNMYVWNIIFTWKAVEILRYVAALSLGGDCVYFPLRLIPVLKIKIQTNFTGANLAGHR